MMPQSNMGSWARTAGVLVLAIAAPFVLSSFATFQLATALSYAPAVLGLVIITGLAGQLALGNGAFFALGAYTTAVLVKTYGFPYWATFPIAAILSLALGVLVGIPSLRLRGHFLAALTLTIAVAAPQIIKYFDWLTNGVRGINVILPDPPEWLGIDANQRAYYVALLVTIASFIATYSVRNSRLGRALRGIQENELVATSLGVNIARLKVAAFGFSTLLAGLGGSCFTITVGYVAPENFTIGLATLLIIGLVIGGKTSEWGAIIGSLFIVILPIYTGRIDPALSGLCFAIAVVITILLLPGGLVSLPGRLMRGAQSLPRVFSSHRRASRNLENAS